MKKTNLPQRSFRPYRLHEMKDGQTTSEQWTNPVDDQRSSAPDSDETGSNSASHQWKHPEILNSLDADKNNDEAERVTLRIGIEEALTTAAHPLKNVECQVESTRLILSGRVRRYYHVQLAICMAQRHCAGRKIINQIEVLPVEFDDLG